MGAVGDKGQGTKPHHHSLQHHITMVCETNMYVAGLTRVFTEHFVFKVSDSELHGLSKRTVFVAGTYGS